MTRRDVLWASAGMAAAYAAQGLPASAEGKQAPIQRIAIAGGGAAGLVAAYRLQSHGLKPTVFEASDRWGGRRPGAEVTAIARSGKGFELSFGAKSEAFDAVVLALPFTKLREVAGIEALGLHPLKCAPSANSATAII